LLQGNFDFVRYFTAKDRFKEKEHQVTAVECRKRQEVNEREADTQKRHKTEKADEADFRRARSDLRYFDRSADGFRERYLSGEQVVDVIKEQAAHLHNIGGAFGQRFEQRVLEMLYLPGVCRAESDPDSAVVARFDGAGE